MNVAITVDRTSSGKQHFEVLDGLRGSAAFLIVVFHLFNYSFSFQGPWALVKHAYLAVDFFFALSGFVVAYAMIVSIVDTKSCRGHRPKLRHTAALRARRIPGPTGSVIVSRRVIPRLRKRR